MGALCLWETLVLLFHSLYLGGHRADLVFYVEPSSVNNSTIMVRSTVSIEPEDSTENTPFFIKPSGFRPNSLFVGRQAQLAEMHKMLFDKKRRAQGTSAILIQSLPGGGKTHLAREYVYEHMDDYPGGTFWLRAKSETELAAGFWDIARKAVFKNAVDKEDTSALQDHDPQQFIKMVKKWLNHREEWLLVLDGMHFDDAETLRKFIPDNKNTSLIYTSTEKSVSGDHHFMNPQVIKLPQLSAREAQRLLLLELDKKEPFSKDDLKYSMELVQAMGFLPVVIHTVAKRLKTTEEPLSKFAKSYSNEPRLRGLGTYMAVAEQLKQHGSLEALNLIHILCFFSQLIPVEMIALGKLSLSDICLPANSYLGLNDLDVDVKATESITGHSLNTTFKHLNMFALIDRNEHEETLQSSQSSKSSRDMLADNVDVIRLHSVVQGFFVDTLSADGSLPLWLNRAVRVFCASFDDANSRITRKTHKGLVEDYRLYEIHGIRLEQHLVRFRKKYPELETAYHTLRQYLEVIKGEIERRTPESSQTIAGGRPDAFQTSIFDRTSSSSDTGPETPGNLDRIYSGGFNWEIGPNKAQLESPISLTHDPEYTRQAVIKQPRNHLRLPEAEDDGYYSDREGSTAMTAQSSQQTVHPAQSPMSPNGPWETVQRRGSKRPGKRDHRTIIRLEKNKYSDRAGSFRSWINVDPRFGTPQLDTKTAQGYVQRSPARAQSRGRMSSHSHAEVVLTHIHKTSPPPARGGGMIQDRRSSSRRAERGRMTAGIASYAAAIADSTKDTIPGFTGILRPATQPLPDTQTSTSTLEGRSQSPAVESLQRFPMKIDPELVPLTLMPPYPPTPGPATGVVYQQPYPSSDTAIDMPGRYSQENLHLGPDPFPSKIYPPMPGTVPVETRDISSSPLKRSLPHDYSVWHSQQYPDSMPSSMYLPPQSQNQSPNLNHLSLSSPNIRRPHSNSSPRPSTYYPGHPELSFTSPPNQHDGGYTSQPMSRDPSGQSNLSAGGVDQDRGRRRASLAETEPLPQLPTFSPRIPATSYQIYMREREIDDLRRLERERSPGYPVRKSPRLGNARAALIERLDSEVINGVEK